VKDAAKVVPAKGDAGRAIVAHAMNVAAATVAMNAAAVIAAIVEDVLKDRPKLTSKS
jgi:hypothetical protein